MSTAAAVQKKFAYDEVQYESFPYAHTHPDHMATVASLFGMKPPKLETARVLEIGCAGGGNILPLALRYPKAKFTGIDLSSEQIAFAKSQQKALDVKNITFECQDIMAFDIQKHKGAFDYVICHGVYSWVPEAVSNRILEVIGAVLSDHGLALVSYNTLPGWNAVRSLCEMMHFHTKRFTNPQEKIVEAKKLLKFLSETAPEGSGYKNILDEEQKYLGNANDSYFYHDHLESVNRQFYLHQFVTDVVRHGLNYVGDASLTSMFVENLTPKAAQALKDMKDLVLQEQYIDFISNRRFRNSIICKMGNKPNRRLEAEKVLDYCYVANMQTEKNPDLSKPVKFTTRSGKGSFTTHAPAASALYYEIIQSGKRPISGPEAIARAVKHPGVTEEAARAALIEHGMKLALRGFILLHNSSPAFADHVAEKPVAYPLARLQAARPGCKGVTNALCQNISVKGISAAVIPLLDGTRTLDDVTHELVKQAQMGRIAVKNNNAIVTDKDDLFKRLHENAATILQQLVGQALLVG